MPSVWQIGAKRPEQVGGHRHQGDLWEFNEERKTSGPVFFFFVAPAAAILGP